MSNTLKFPNTEHLKPLPIAIEDILRSLGINEQTRKEAREWVEAADRAYRIPDFELSISLPDGLTDYQATSLRNEIHREFASYGDQLRVAKHTYIVTEVKRRIGFIA